MKLYHLPGPEADIIGTVPPRAVGITTPGAGRLTTGAAILDITETINYDWFNDLLTVCKSNKLRWLII